MREAYLLNSSQTITSVPLYEKLPVTVCGREVQKLQFKELVPGEEFIVGTDIDAEKRKYYSQFKPIKIELKFREIKKVEEKTPEAFIEDNTDSEEAPVVYEDSEEAPVVYEESDLMKKRQVELIEIAKGLGIEATTQESKAEITRKILEFNSVE